MFGWCDKCKVITIDGWCSDHGETRPVKSINKVDVCPLPEFKKEYINNRTSNLTLGDGIFLVYGDRLRRNITVALDEPLLEIKVKKEKVDIKELKKGYFNGMDTVSLYNANSNRLTRLAKISHSFAKQEIESSKNAIISFSGGKDSMVLSHLLSDFNLKNVFIDTGMEFPETYEFINTLKEKGWDIDIARSKNNFFELCSEKGYPVRKNRWCCKTQKFEPFNDYIKSQYGENQVTVFGAERRWESLYRIDEPFKRQNKNIPNQHSVHIMLDWTAMDVWMYIFNQNLPINKIYDYYDRAGCWPCPFGLTYRSFLMEMAHPRLHEYLVRVGATKSLRSYWEGKPMRNLVFNDITIMNAVADKLGTLIENFEVHSQRKIISIPAQTSKIKIESLVKDIKSEVAL